VDGKSAKTDARVASLASGQHGVITYAQLRGQGVSRGDIEGRVRRGALHRVHQGVYAVGHPGLSRGGRYMAALLAVGDGAVLSHASAAVLWGGLLPPNKVEEPPVHVSLPSPNGRCRRDGIAIHRTAFAPGDLSRRARIPLTTPNRTLLDLRRSNILEPKLLRKAIGQAQHRRLRLDPRLRRDRTRSGLEKDFRAFVRRHRLPRSTPRSATSPSTSSGAPAASRSKPTATSGTTASSPSRTTTSAT
jgi:hypothetical protein